MNRNAHNVTGGARLFAAIKDREAKLAFLDPQYRAGLDKLAYGNEGERQKGRANLPQMSDEMIRFFVQEIERSLKPGGHLVLWLDKFSIVSAHWHRWLPAGKPGRDGGMLESVDMATWNKGRPGMGRRLRCRTEFAIILQKPPIRAKGVWTDHGIDDCWLEDADRQRHPHAKPLQLTQRLVRTMTKRGDLVIDPAAGGYCVLEACKATGREFFGCDVVEPAGRL